MTTRYFLIDAGAMSTEMRRPAGGVLFVVHRYPVAMHVFPPLQGRFGLLTLEKEQWRPMLFSEMVKLGLCEQTALTEVTHYHGERLLPRKTPLL